MSRHPSVEDVMQYFTYEHLPERLQATSKIFWEAATNLLNNVAVDSPQLTIALQDLLRAKDAAVRAKLVSGGA